MIHTRWFELDAAMASYTAAWLLCVAWALTHLLVKRGDYAAAYRGYRAFLFAPWKLVSSGPCGGSRGSGLACRRSSKPSWASEGPISSAR